MRFALKSVRIGVRDFSEVDEVNNPVRGRSHERPNRRAVGYSHRVPTIHPTAIIEGDVTLGEGVVVGPWCLLRGTLGPLVVGANTILRANVHLEGPLTIGQGNDFSPFCSIGCAPQDIGTPQSMAGAGVVIGDSNIFRESVTIARPKWDKPGRIGNSNYWMANSHAGHDCIIGNNCVFGNGSLLAGHVEVADRVITGGGSAVHQFVRVGRGAFISGLSGSVHDVCPYFVITGISYAGSFNLIGLRRSGASHETIDTVRWVFRTVCRSKLLPKRSLEVLRSRAGEPIVDEYIQFIESSKRGIAHAHGRVAGE